MTTPQEVSLSDVSKALAMFKRLSVPVLGVVENMTAFVCPGCGEAHEIFGRGGGERFAASTASPSWAASRSTSPSASGDVGVPAVAQREPGAAARALTAIAGSVAAHVSVRAAAAENSQPPSRSAEADGLDFRRGFRGADGEGNAVRCGACGAPTRATARFCDQCGASLVLDGRAERAERPRDDIEAGDRRIVLRSSPTSSTTSASSPSTIPRTFAAK